MPPPRSRRFCRTSTYSGRICVTRPKIKGANSGRPLTKRLSIKRWLMLRLGIGLLEINYFTETALIIINVGKTVLLQ